jgi:hypothetical protein
MQDATSYQKLVDAAEFAETLPALRTSLKEANCGQGVPAATVLTQLRTKLGLKR